MQVELPSPAVSAEEARRAVAEVLGRSEYDGLEPGLLDRLLAALSEGFGRLLSAFSGTAAGTVAGWAVLALLVLGLIWILMRSTRSLRADPTLRSVASADDIGRSQSDWLADAAAHEEAGRWRDAVRCRYRALVAALAAAGRLEEVAGRTAGEYLVALRAAEPAAGPPFEEATRLFERAWYGAERVGAAESRALAEAADRTLSAVRLRRAGVSA